MSKSQIEEFMCISKVIAALLAYQNGFFLVAYILATLAILDGLECIWFAYKEVFKTKH